MGIDIPQIKTNNAQQWVEAQIKFHHGLCTGFWHQLFYRKITMRNSKTMQDKTSASLEICNKCNGIRNAWITVSLRNIFVK